MAYIEKRAKELGQKYFPNEENIWARPNWEAQKVESACLEMAKTTQDLMIQKACSAYCKCCDTQECEGTFECDWVSKFEKRLKSEMKK